MAALAVVTGTLMWAGIAGAQEQNRPQVYWSDRCASTIERANVDGTGVETVVTGLSPFEPVVDLGIDALNRRLYWSAGGTIRRAQLDGSGVEQVVSGAGALALDPANDGLFYVGSPDTIWRGQLDGSDSTMLLSSLSPPAGLAVDPDGAKIYWTEPLVTKFDPLHPTVRRANLDGTAVEGLVDPHDSPGPYAITVDASGGKLYWADNIRRAIVRTNLDGSYMETMWDMSGDLSLVLDLAFDAESSDLYLVWMRDIMPRYATVIRWDLDEGGLTEVARRDGPCLGSVAFDPMGEPAASATPTATTSAMPSPTATLSPATATPAPQALPSAGRGTDSGDGGLLLVALAAAGAGGALAVAGWLIARRRRHPHA
jgi:hypothetical protein